MKTKDSIDGASEFISGGVAFAENLNSIGSSSTDVSQIQGFKKYAKASSIKDRFHNLVKEFEAVMTDLHFSLAVANEEQRRLDQESLNEDIEQMKHACI
ncbi:12301_t:CDS:2 [Funneliformis caledonium]|uniref:12301_t:CDS:1 n=1 Tax=Funneliformis caledonium TaxID=1117310 RepID=A0A9N9GKM4_9GLOM|nr:12301_t:CDS:2 [Funneliformis caledonium]